MGVDPLADDLVGRTLGDFVLGDPIGSGGFGAVYAAHQPALERDAVIKVLARERREQRRGAERFLREAKLASKLDHPFAAHIYAFGAEPDGLLWIAMERVHGTTLRELLRVRGPLSLAQFVPFFDRLGEVVSAAHDQGIIHRDLKPENIMVVSRGGRLSPKLLDLGIARLTDDDDDEETTTPLADGPVGRLTADGGITGSPHYMAPEQWVSPRSAGAAADQYALGAIAFESLTGTLAFPGTRVFEVARAHAKKPPPSLPSELPEALSRAIETALGKQVADRHDSVAEMVAAIREATGGVPEGMLLPELDAELAARFREAGPQPIAAAVFAYSSATTITRASAALASVTRAILHLLGVAALAAHSRRAAGQLPSELAAQLAALRQRGLRDLEWLSLARGLTAQFAEKADVHPMPELVLLMHDQSAPSLTEICEFGLKAAVDHPDALSSLRESAVAVDALLARVSFLLEYPLVVRSDHGMQAWQGTRPRRFANSFGNSVGDVPIGHVMCVDTSGTVVFDMHPLLQVAAPTQGSERELFLLSGPGRRGARLSSHPVDYAIEDDSLWSWFADILELELEHGVAATISTRAPYRGLTPFAAGDADWFFGREDEAQALANRLSTQSFVAIVGPSGAGKSSFIRAGVVPLLAGEWQTLELRPGHNPRAGLSTVLASQGLDADIEALGETLLQWSKETGKGVLVVVDQFEELFTLCRDSEERERFVTALLGAASDDDLPIRLVLTLRDDFLMLAESLPVLGPRLARGLELLGTPSEDGLRRILIEPARRAGFEYEDEALVDEMVGEVASKPGALPLLSFTASKLWELRDRHFKRLSRVAYESLGGVGGALAQHAGAIVESLSKTQAGLVREAFRHLVTAEGTRAVLTRLELEQLLGGGAEAGTVIEELIGGRLLVASEAADGADQIEITHEALLDAWPQLVEWRQQDAENARLRDQLRAAARQWSERDKPRGLLWRSDALAEYKLWRTRYSGRLTNAEAEFGRASLSDAARLRNIRRFIVALAFVALTIGLAVIYRSELRAQASADESERRLALFYREQGRRELASGNPAHALVYLTSVTGVDAKDPALSYLYARAKQAFAAERVGLPASAKSLFGVAVSADATRAITVGEDGIPRIWSLPSGELVKALTDVHQRVLYSIELTHDGRFVTAGDDSFAVLWGANGEVIAKLAGHSTDAATQGIYTARFDQSGERIITAGDDQTARLWSARTGKPLAILRGNPESVIDARFCSDGKRALTAGLDGIVRIFDTDPSSERFGTVLTTLAHHSGPLFSARWSHDDALVLTTSVDGTATLSDGVSGDLLHRLEGHTGWVTDAIFSADDRRVATVSRDATAAVYDVKTGERIVTLTGHAGQVNRARFIDDDRLATASADGSVRLWSLQTGALEELFVGHTALVFDAQTTSKGELVTASWDGTARVWDLARRRVQFAVGSDRDFRVPDEARGQARGLQATSKNWLVVAADKRRALVQSRADGNTRWIEFASDVSALSLSETPSKGGTSLAVGLVSGELRILNPADTSDHGSVGTRFPTPIITIADGGKDGGWLVTEASGQVSRLDEQGQRIKEVTKIDEEEFRNSGAGVMSAVRALADGSVVVVSAARARRVHGARSEVIFETDSEIIDVAFSDDGQAVAFATRDVVTVWRAGTSATLQHDARQTAVALNADGSRLLAGSEGGEVILWHVVRGKALARASIHGGWITSLEIDPSGRYGLTAGADQKARIVDLRDLVVLDSLEPHAGEILTASLVGNGRAALIWAPQAITLWDVSTAAVDSQQAADFVRCRSGWMMGDGRVVLRESKDSGCGP